MKYHIYKSKDGWRWRLKARNGRIIADSGEAYRSQKHCLRMVEKVRCDKTSIVVED